MNNSSTSKPSDPLRALVCPQCGAPLSEKQAQLETITCAHCGIVFKRSKAAPQGGINLSVGGKATIRGHVVGGDVIHAPHGQSPSDRAPGGGVSIHAGDLHIGGNLVGRDHVIVISKPPGRLARLRAWFANLVRRPK